MASQKGVDGRSQWRTGTRETEVKLEGWCEGCFRQLRNDDGGAKDQKDQIDQNAKDQKAKDQKAWRALVHM